MTITVTITILGFGGYSSHLRKYAYAKKGQPAILSEKKLKENLTLTAFISKFGVEAFQFFSGGGTQVSYFEELLDNFIDKIKEKY